MALLTKFLWLVLGFLLGFIIAFILVHNGDNDGTNS